MKQLATAVAIITLAALFAGSTSAAQGQRRGGPKSPVEMLQEQQELMFRECKLSEEQQKTLKEKFKAKQDALEAWEKANGAKLKAAEEAAKAARQGTDDAAKRKANDEVKTLTTARTEATAETTKAVLAALTDEQKIAWAGVELAQATLKRFQKATLNEEQVAKVKSASALAAKDLAGYPGDDKKDKQGRATINKALLWAVENVILTPEQRELVARKPAAAKPK